MVEQELRKLARMVATEVDFSAIEQLFASRLEDDSIKVARAFESNFDTVAGGNCDFSRCGQHAQTEDTDA